VFILITVHTGTKNYVMPHVAFHTFPVPEFSSPAFSGLAFSASPDKVQGHTRHIADYLWMASSYSFRPERRFPLHRPRHFLSAASAVVRYS